MERIADGNWDDDTEEKLGEAIRDAIDDFGPDFDEEGNELAGGRVRPRQVRGGAREGRPHRGLRASRTTMRTPTRTTTPTRTIPTRTRTEAEKSEYDARLQTQERLQATRTTGA